MHDLKTTDKTYVANTYARFPVEIVSGKGSVVYDEMGKRYIDMGSGIGVTSFGIADETWAQAVTAQLGKVQHMSNLYYTEPCAQLAQMLCERTGMKKVFFSNSGAEANECAIKAARKYAAYQKGAAYSTIITLQNSFHGRTLTTLAATGQAHYHELFQPLTPGFVHAEAGNLESVKALARHHKVAAVMIECIQGEGGVIPLSQEFVQGLAAFAAQEDILLIVDEVQTGNGRTGALYAYMNYGVQPDIVSTAKGLGGGLPLGATLLGDKVQDTLQPGDHGSTFGGNTFACAVSLAAMRYMIDNDFSAVAREKGAYLMDAVRKIKSEHIAEVRGMGLLIGIQLKDDCPAGDVMRRMLARGFVPGTASGNVIRLAPPLIISYEEMDAFVAALAEELA